MEVENILLAAMCRMIHRTRRVYRKHVAVVRVVFLAAIVFLCALGVSGGSRILISAGMGKTSGLQTGIIEVQAAEVEETEAAAQLQAGLMGVVNGAITMDAYSQAASEIDTASANENILVGAARASRTERRRTSLGKSAQSAQSVFVCAREVVKSYQMPESEYYTLLRIVEAEATGEDLEGKMLIANVILNRDSRIRSKRLSGSRSMALRSFSRPLTGELIPWKSHSLPSKQWTESLQEKMSPRGHCTLWQEAAPMHPV